MENDALIVSMFCNVITPEDIPNLAKIVPNPTLLHLFEFIEKFKSARGVQRIPQKTIAIGVKVINRFNQPVFNVSVFFDLVVYLTTGDSKSFKFALPSPHIESKGESDVLLFDLSGLPKATFKVDAVTFVYGDGTVGTRHKGTFPYLIDASEITNSFGGFRNQNERETFFLLDNYAKEGLYARGWLLTILKKALEEVNSDRFTFNGNIVPFRGSELAKARSIIQVDIISKIMMYIEDSAILLLGNKTVGQNFYDLLDRKDPDLGQRITDFLNHIDSITDEEYRSMLSYVDPEKLNLPADQKALIKKLIDQNIAEIKDHLRQNKQFRDTHGQVFRRYKHAGLAMLLGGEANSPYPYSGKKFDSNSLVFSGEDPMKDAIPIPYSADVLAAYDVMISTLQKMIIDIVDNKLGCLHRRIDGMIPLDLYGPLDKFLVDEIRTINTITMQFYEERPFRASNNYFQLKTPVKKEQIQWYVDLDKYLAETKAKGELERRQNKSLRDQGL